MYQLKNGLWSATGIITGSVPAVGDFIGSSVDISDDGTRVIFGAPYSDSNKGYAEVYEYDGANWTILGAKLYGVNPAVVARGAGDYIGFAVAISGDGTRVAVGAPWVVVAVGISTGGAVTYEWNSGTTTWDTYGATMIVRPIVDSALGHALALSTDGSQVLVGIPSLANFGDTTSTTVGSIQLFELVSGTWTQETVQNGSVANGAFGYSVSMNGSGNTIVGGAPYATVNTLSSAGYATVYRKDRAGTWAQRGSRIAGLQSSAQAGTSVSLSTSGNRIAVGYPVNTLGQPVNGFARVHQYKSNTWSQLGSNIENDATYGNTVIRPVTLSGDGTLLITGRPFYDSQNLTKSGQVNTYRLEITSEARCCPAVPIRRPVRC